MTLVLESPVNYICRSWKVLGKPSFKTCLGYVQYVLTSFHASLFALAVVFVLGLFNGCCLPLKFTFLRYENVLEK